MSTTQRIRFLVLAATLLTGLASGGCLTQEEARRAGYAEGHTQGQKDGLEEGFGKGRKEGFHDGVEQGRKVGTDEGFEKGRAAALESERIEARNRGIPVGVVAGSGMGLLLAGIVALAVRWHARRRLRQRTKAFLAAYDAARRPVQDLIDRQWVFLCSRRARSLKLVDAAQAASDFDSELGQVLSTADASIDEMQWLPRWARAQMKQEIREDIHGRCSLAPEP